METIKDFNDWHFLGKMIATLQKDLILSASSKEKAEKWLSLSNSVIDFCNSHFLGESIKYTEPALRITRYLRCNFFWITQDWVLLNQEIEKSLKEDKSAIFYILKGFFSLHHIANQSHFLLDKSLNPSVFPELKTKKQAMKEAEFAFNEAFSLIKEEKDYHLKSTILWSKAWMLYKLNKKDLMADYARKAWDLDGKNTGEGWNLWAQWLGRIIDPLENLILLETLKK